MKKFFLISFFCCFLIPQVVMAKSVSEILKEIDAIRNYKTASMEAEMRIVDRNGSETKMSIISYEKNTDKDRNLMRFTNPPRLKDTAILTIEDNIWYYNKRTNRVRLLSQSAKTGSMMGSSFSYEDLSSKFSEAYTGKILKEEKNTYILILSPFEKNKTFEYLKVTVDKQYMVPVLIEYFKPGHIKYKEMVSENIQKIKGKTIALNTKMTDLQSGKITYFEINPANVAYDIELKDSLFSEQNLKK